MDPVSRLCTIDAFRRGKDPPESRTPQAEAEKSLATTCSSSPLPLAVQLSQRLGDDSRMGNTLRQDHCPRQPRLRTQSADGQVTS